jgi:phage terminase small subunit
MAEVDWAAIRCAYESARQSVAALAREYGVSRDSIARRARAEGWCDQRRRPPPAVPAAATGEVAPSRLAPPPDPAPPADGLTARQRLFVAEYLVDLDAAAAARRVGVEGAAAAAEGEKWQADPAVRAAIEAGLGARVARAGITADRVLQELARIGFAVMTDFVSWTDDQVAVRDSASLTRDQAAAITELSRTRDGVRVKFDKLPALNALARYLGLPGAGQGAAGAERDDALVIRPDEPIPEKPIL